jgi:hypothetical protein
MEARALQAFAVSHTLKRQRGAMAIAEQTLGIEIFKGACQ